jgi:DNA-directed RNA polymerase subunit RPC12/RpoP
MLAKYYLCSECGETQGIGFANSLPESITHCPECGGKLITECSSCKKPIMNSSNKFCPFCGKEYSED